MRALPNRPIPVADTRTRSRIRGIVAAIAVTFAAAGAQAAIPATERQALLDLYAQTHGAQWIQNDGWGGGAGSECDWTGIQCTPDQQHVMYLDLSSNNLVGTLPSSLSNLTQLQDLFVGHNALSGTIPSLAGLTQLKALQANANQLSGPFPSLAGLVNLEAIYIIDNDLSGDMPQPPNPALLIPGGSALCPNAFNPTPSVAWDAATAVTPWYLDCAADDVVFADGFELP